MHGHWHTKERSRKTKKTATDTAAVFFMVPEIGVEPTRREALAPETSVSTISPLGLEKVGQRYKMFLNYELIFNLFHQMKTSDIITSSHSCTSTMKRLRTKSSSIVIF